MNGCERSVDVIHLLFFLFGGRNGTKNEWGLSSSNWKSVWILKIRVWIFVDEFCCTYAYLGCRDVASQSTLV